MGRNEAVHSGPGAPAPGRGDRRLAALELGILYLLAPGLILSGAIPLPARWLVFAATAVYVATVLLRTRPDPRALGLVPVRTGLLAILIALVSSALGTVTLLWATGRIPAETAVRWLLVFGAYPALSVPAQEVFFRGFYFARYGALLPRRAGAVLNAVLFALYHSIFGFPLAIVAALLAGLVLAFLFVARRDIYLCWLLHYAFGTSVYLTGWAHGFTGLSGF